MLCGLALLILVAVGVGRWKDLAAAYYFHRIENDPRYFLKAVSAPDGSPAREAAMRYLAREGSFVRFLDALREGEGGLSAVRTGPGRPVTEEGAGESLRGETEIRDTALERD